MSATLWASGAYRRRLPGEPLPLVVVERDMHAHHTYLAGRHPELFEDLCFAHFQDRELEAEDGLELLGEGLAPRRAAVHLYGGGYLNRWWGERKVAHVAERSAGLAALHEDGQRRSGRPWRRGCGRSPGGRSAASARESPRRPRRGRSPAGCAGGSPGRR